MVREINDVLNGERERIRIIRKIKKRRNLQIISYWRREKENIIRTFIISRRIHSKGFITQSRRYRIY